MAVTMHPMDSISGAAGECYVTINGRRYNGMSVISLEAKAEVIKAEVPILGKISRGNKAVGIKYSGSCRMHYNTSIFREIMLEYKRTGQNPYFEIQVTNEDKTSNAGRQTVILKDVNLNSIFLAKVDASATDGLDEDVEFTFEDFEIPTKFNSLAGSEA